MTNHMTEARPNTIARIAGIFYLIIIFAGVFAEFFVRSSLIVSGDAAATFNKIVESESIFRISIAADLAMIIADLIVAVALYALLRPINRNLALLAAFSRVIMDSILGVNLLNLLAVLMLVDGNSGLLAAFDTAQSHALVMSLLDAHALGYSIGLIPFGLGTLVIGHLLFTSNYVPRPVSVLLSLAAVVYLAGSFVHILAPDMYDTFSVAYVLPFVAELALALWLTFKGVSVRLADRRPVVPAVAS